MEIIFFLFQKWFEFLDEMIKKTDYEWYVKEHPASSLLTKNKVEDLFKKNQIKILN